MNPLEEEWVYEQKLDRITEQIEELILDAMLAALQKMRKRNLSFSEAQNDEKPQQPF